MFDHVASDAASATGILTRAASRSPTLKLIDERHQMAEISTELVQTPAHEHVNLSPLCITHQQVERRALVSTVNAESFQLQKMQVASPRNENIE